MKKLTRRLMLSILSVAFAVIALGTTTYAWFTLGNSVTVSQISAEVVSDTGIEVSLDDATWYSNMSAEVVNNYITNNSINTELDAICMSSLANGEFEFTDVLGEGAGSTKYLQLHFYVRYNGNDNLQSGEKAALYLKNCQLDSTSIAWTSDVTITDETDEDYNLTAGTSYTYYPSDAARVTVSTEEDAGYLFTCQAYGHTVSSTYTAITYGDGTDKQRSTSGTSSEGFAQLYASKKGYDLSNAEAEASSLTLVTPAANYGCTVTDGTPQGATYIGDFTSSTNKLDAFVTIWLDGWDDECINAILDGQLKLKLEFAVTDKYSK